VSSWNAANASTLLGSTVLPQPTAIDPTGESARRSPECRSAAKASASDDPIGPDHTPASERDQRSRIAAEGFLLRPAMQHPGGADGPVSPPLAKVHASCKHKSSSVQADDETAGPGAERSRLRGGCLRRNPAAAGGSRTSAFTIWVLSGRTTPMATKHSLRIGLVGAGAHDRFRPVAGARDSKLAAWDSKEEVGVDGGARPWAIAAAGARRRRSAVDGCFHRRACYRPDPS
jgi:hypothetical protein